MPNSLIYLNELQGVVDDDIKALRKAQESYGHSWKKRGGIGVFMNLARKWDRLENSMTSPMSALPFDILERTAKDPRAEGLIDTIRDLRRYLLLTEAELRAQGNCPGLLAKDVEEGIASKGGKFRESIVRGDHGSIKVMIPDTEGVPQYINPEKIVVGDSYENPLDEFAHRGEEMDDTPPASVLHPQ